MDGRVKPGHDDSSGRGAEARPRVEAAGVAQALVPEERAWFEARPRPEEREARLEGRGRPHASRRRTLTERCQPASFETRFALLRMRATPRARRYSRWPCSAMQA